MNPAPAPPEAALVQAAAGGDPEAFETLVRPHLGMLFRVIDRILGNEAESQDALQDALLTILRELPGFQGASKFSTWAYRICVNQALMARRKRIRRREDAIEDLMPRFADDGHHKDVDLLLEWSEDAEALMKVERDELKARVRMGLDRLSDDQRAVFVLRDLEGWDTDEISRHLGITRELVRQRVHRARLALRALLPEFAPRLAEDR
ncbi:MAG TPA: sigma-70 family RNA polymerase sigma factor [Geothrix sp.]|uniref:RNA polymerase sigma factor n=1 Tax=Geothrix mesophila TaxID=2922723 RepID=UPI001FADA07D|nr:sigma-70 family RNA polymerase sigma factor [Geothrix sp. SG198]HJV39649.1 sigma-70 family RNA polymerase sigma factor [Geothrix sp.]